ncbi:MAG: hypothetical protein KC442_13070 [Thermomicrobiales bacterium]|nr:hypothetical protein [Thermomicrobiales bacterium]
MAPPPDPAANDAESHVAGKTVGAAMERPRVEAEQTQKRPAVELRCARHLHGVAVGDIIEVRCRECAKLQGVPEVIHRWRMTAEGIALLQEGERRPPHINRTMSQVSGSLQNSRSNSGS